MHDASITTPIPSRDGSKHNIVLFWIFFKQQLLKSGSMHTGLFRGQKAPDCCTLLETFKFQNMLAGILVSMSGIAQSGI